MNLSSANNVGILLPQFEGGVRGTPLEELMRRYIESTATSRSARELLQSASPSRCRSDGNEKRLIAREGSSLPRDPFSEAIRRCAKNNGWSLPSFEDALRVFPSISPHLFSGSTKFLVFMHEPVKEKVLGCMFLGGVVTLTAYKAEPREGWFGENGGFVFREK